MSAKRTELFISGYVLVLSSNEDCILAEAVAAAVGATAGAGWPNWNFHFLFHSSECLCWDSCAYLLQTEHSKRPVEAN